MKKLALPLTLILLSAQFFAQTVLAFSDVAVDSRYYLPVTELEKEGILVSAIRPPSVPKDMSRLRLTVIATHTKEEIE